MKYPKIRLSDKKYLRMIEKHKKYHCILKIKGELKILADETFAIPDEFLTMKPKNLSNFVDLDEVNNSGSTKIAGLKGKRAYSKDFDGRGIRIFNVVTNLTSQFKDSVTGESKKYLAIQFAYIDKDTKEIIDDNLYTATSRSKVLFKAFGAPDIQFPVDVILTLNKFSNGKTKYKVTAL